MWGELTFRDVVVVGGGGGVVVGRMDGWKDEMMSQQHTRWSELARLGASQSLILQS